MSFKMLIEEAINENHFYSRNDLENEVLEKDLFNTFKLSYGYPIKDVIGKRLFNLIKDQIEFFSIQYIQVNSSNNYQIGISEIKIKDLPEGIVKLQNVLKKLKVKIDDIKNDKSIIDRNKERMMDSSQYLNLRNKKYLESYSSFLTRNRLSNYNFDTYFDEWIYNWEMSRYEHLQKVIPYLKKMNLIIQKTNIENE